MKVKRFLSGVFGCVLIVSLLSGCADKTATDDTYKVEGRNGKLWEITSDMSLNEALKLESRNFKIVKSMEPLYEEESYSDYKDAISTMDKNKDQSSVDAAIAARENLNQTSTVEDRIWWLWGDTIPVVDGESYTEEELDLSKEDAYGSEPFIIKYLIDNPKEAKGNIILVSGGGMQMRGNKSEGYPAAIVFNELGYNVFLLQRRVAPYSDMDIFMDFQRAVRLVRYYIEKEKYGGADMIAGAGWSGGGLTVQGAIDNCYGDLTPADVGATTYVPDKFDALSSDLDVAMIIYGAADTAVNENNTNWPAFYICSGTADTTGAGEKSQILYDNVKDKVTSMMNLIDGAPHGYGVGTVSMGSGGIVPGTDLWPAQADIFMQENLGHSGN